MLNDVAFELFEVKNGRKDLDTWGEERDDEREEEREEEVVGWRGGSGRGAGGVEGGRWEEETSLRGLVDLKIAGVFLEGLGQEVGGMLVKLDLIFFVW